MKDSLLGACVLLCVLLASACESEDEKASTLEPGGGACLDRPGQLARPPSRGLPCELLPPNR